LASDSTPAAVYARRCAPCHGARGGGDGPNARFLPVRPTAHADSALMSARSDDELFDTIFAGGYVMNRSNRMPPFGETLSRAEIWALVRYVRTLCRCQQPAWARGS
jgi:mono/diheme cytochrome c family protein